MSARFPLVLSFLVLAAPVSAQPKDDVDPDLRFWADARRQQAAAAAQVIVARDPFISAGLRLEGKRLNVWNEPEYELELNAHWLKRIRDDALTPDLSKRENVAEIRESEWAFRFIRDDALLKAFQAPLDVFKKSGADNDPVRREQLMGNPPFYRGKVVGLKGQLLKLDVLDAPADLMGHFEHYYEAVIKPRDEDKYVIATFSMLPDALKTYQNSVLKKPVPVEFYGYFIMRLKHAKGDGKEEVSPLLIGQTIEPGVAPAAPAEGSGGGMSIPLWVLLILAGVFTVVVVLMFGLRWWYRVEDRKILEKIRQVREARYHAEALAHLHDEPARAPDSASQPAERNGTPAQPSTPTENPPGDSLTTDH